MEQTPLRAYHLVHLLAGNGLEILDKKAEIEVSKEDMHASKMDMHAGGEYGKENGYKNEEK